MRTLPVILTMCLLVLPVHAKYSGGSGTADDPYRIATAADLIALGETPADYEKHFVVTADIDLAPGLPGGRVFTKAPIAPHAGTFGWPFSGPAFAGVLDGGGHTIRNLNVDGIRCAGLIGQMAFGAEVKNLRLVGVNVTGSDGYSGGLVGLGDGAVTNCSSSGTVRGFTYIGGLVGYGSARITRCFSGGMVFGTKWSIGGLVGYSCGRTQQCYSTAAVTGAAWVGGLVGESANTVIECYSTGLVNGGSPGGGLIGKDYPYSQTTRCFWDMESSGQSGSAGGTKKTTANMQKASTFLGAGWDFAGETANGTEDVWWIDEGKDYPHLSWETYHGKYGGGSGTEDDPYLIRTAEQMNDIGVNPGDWRKHFKLAADIDLSGFDGKNGRPAFNLIGPDPDPSTWYFDQYAVGFSGVFDGDGHTISHLTIAGQQSYLGLFCYLDFGAEVRNLGILDVELNTEGRMGGVGALAGYTLGALVSRCYSTGVVTSRGTPVGGLVGYNRGELTECFSLARVSGTSYSAGGLVGENWGTVTDCYSTGVVGGTATWVGGLVGGNYGSVARCYSIGAVSGKGDVGGLVGIIGGGPRTGGSGVTQSFWDIETSGRETSAGGTGKTTSEMQTVGTFLDAGWDFVEETANGEEDTWMMSAETGYPFLPWREPKAPALNVEDFETGDFKRFPWEHLSNVPWTITSTRSHKGKHSARAGALGDRTARSTLKLTLNCAAGEIRFFVRVSSEPIWDKLVFQIDGQLMGEWSGEQEWTEVAFRVAAGTRTFQWDYMKDKGAQGEDTAWLDDIVFPLP